MHPAREGSAISKQPGNESESDSRSKRNTRLYLTGLAASYTGSAAMSVAAGIWVKSLTGDSGTAAAVSACIYAPSLLAPLAGLLADRTHQQRLLLIVNLASATLMSTLTLVDSPRDIWLIYLVMCGCGISLVILDPAEVALFTALLPPEARQQVNGSRLAIQESGKLVAPLLGAWLFTVVGGGVVALLDAATFALSALMIARLRVPRVPRPHPRVTVTARGWHHELWTGFRHIHQVRQLRTLVLAAVSAMLVSAVTTAAQFSLVDALERSPSFLGLLIGCVGAGSVLAGLSSGRLIDRFDERTLAILGLLNGALGYALRATGWTPAALIGSVVLGFALPWTVVAVANLAQRVTPAPLQGRVAAATTWLLFAPLSLAQLAGAATINLLGYQAVYSAAAVATLAIAACLASVG